MTGSRVVRVECKTCRALHAFRNTTPKAAASSRPRVPRQDRSANIQMDYQRRMRLADINAAAPYSVASSFDAGAVLRHTTFGVGFVTKVLEGKIEVLFEAGAKTLATGKA